MTPIATSRLVLEPVTRDLAGAIVAGRFTELRRGVGWPHADTADAMGMALTTDSGPCWLITLDGVVIGDCGAFSWPAGEGVVEIGYGLAEPSRDKGYATEAAEAMCRWLLGEAGATAITATAVRRGNLASRRVLERLGFVVIHQDEEGVSYRLDVVPT